MTKILSPIPHQDVEIRKNLINNRGNTQENNEFKKIRTAKEIRNQTETNKNTAKTHYKETIVKKEIMIMKNQKRIKAIKDLKNNEIIINPKGIKITISLKNKAGITGITDSNNRKERIAKVDPKKITRITIIIDRADTRKTRKNITQILKK